MCEDCSPLCHARCPDDNTGPGAEPIKEVVTRGRASPVPAQCQPRSVSTLLPRDTERKRKVLQSILLKLSHSALDTGHRSTLRGWGGKWSAHHNSDQKITRQTKTANLPPLSLRLLINLLRRCHKNRCRRDH